MEKNKLKSIFTTIGLIMLMCMVLVAMPNSSDAAAKYTFKFASIYPPPDIAMEAEAAQYWMDQVTKHSNGAIVFKPFWGASLSAPPATVDLIKNGVVQAGQSFYWYTPGRFPIGEFEYVFPFGPPDPVIVAKALRQIRSEFP